MYNVVSPFRGSFTHTDVTHGGTHRFTSGRRSTTPPPLPLLPPQSSWEGKKKLFCIGGINSRHLDAARNRDFGGSINLKTDRSRPDRPEMSLSVPKSKPLVRARRINPDMWALRWGFIVSTAHCIFDFPFRERRFSPYLLPPSPSRCICRETATEKISHFIENIFGFFSFLFKPAIEFMAARFDCEKHDSVPTRKRRSAEKGTGRRLL